MKKREWTFLSNHGTVLAYLAKHPRSTVQTIAQEAGLSIRGVQNIIADLEKEGYLLRQKEGRCNRYIVDPGRPMRHRLQRSYSIGSMLEAVGYSVKDAAMAADECANINRGVEVPDETKRGELRWLIEALSLQPFVLAKDFPELQEAEEASMDHH